MRELSGISHVGILLNRPKINATVTTYGRGSPIDVIDTFAGATSTSMALLIYGSGLSNKCPIIINIITV